LKPSLREPSVGYLVGRARVVAAAMAKSETITAMWGFMFVS
jgi:hypothetical protein